MAPHSRPRRTRLRDLIARGDQTSALIGGLIALAVAIVAAPGIGAGAVAAPPRATLADGPNGPIAFHGQGQGRALVLSADLDFPRDLAGPAPAIVLMPDLPGPAEIGARAVAAHILDAGWAVMTVDGFGPRGLTTAETAAGLAILRRVEDAYAAHALLRTHPLVRADRIVLLGLGVGGTVALQAGLTHLREAARGRDGFAGRVAITPNCSLQWRDLRSEPGPLLMQLAGQDSIGGTSHCEDWARRLRGGGARVQVRTYPGLAAAWDAAPFDLPGVPQLDRCFAFLDVDGSVTDRTTGVRHVRDQIAGWLAGCRTLGRRSGGGDAAQRDRATADLTAFLGEVSAGR